MLDDGDQLDWCFSCTDVVSFVQSLAGRRILDRVSSRNPRLGLKWSRALILVTCLTWVTLMLVSHPSSASPGDVLRTRVEANYLFFQMMTKTNPRRALGTPWWG